MDTEKLLTDLRDEHQRINSAIVDAPDNISIATFSLGIGSTGLVNVRTTPLLTVEEVDQALAMSTKYGAPGQEK